MIYHCEAFDKACNHVLMFGLVLPVRTFAPEQLDRYCTARNQYGNMYDIYTDYDPCLRISNTVAVMLRPGRKENERCENTRTELPC